jgi:hypothetical protein
MFLAVLVIAGSLFTPGLSDYTDYTVSRFENNYVPINRETDPSKTTWDQSAINWLLEAQSPNGGWGAGSHAYQNITDPHLVQTDPATTSFAAMALLKAGGPLNENPYKEQILKALDRLLSDIDKRPDNGRITSLEGTQPQVKLGIHIDASMALQFLTEMRDQVEDKSLGIRIDKAAEVCIDLIQGSQNANGGWAGGGWAPVLQSAMANNALEIAQKRYDVDQGVIDQSRKYQADNISTDGVKSEDAAGVPLYAAVSAQRATASDAQEVEKLLEPGMVAGYSSGKVKKDEISKALESKGVSRDKADQMANSYAVNYTSSQALQNEDIWQGFGNNGGEEYLSYMLTSEALAQQGKEEWMKWRQSIEPKFKQAQNQNGSWSGQHCITSPVFCTAAVIQAWTAGIQ